MTRKVAVLHEEENLELAEQGMKDCRVTLATTLLEQGQKRISGFRAGAA